MPRSFPLPQLALLACAVALPLGCKTVYTETYSPHGNHFVPPPEKKIELPVDKKTTPAPLPVVPAAGAGQPAIPGLAPVPDMQGLPAPAP